ncbi:hypothetical protein [Demetria terragena]|uniref:hypothetical protein n=1 Tax=Demetria terragena TaxID=63959 RepID=UPI0003683EBD|nr:hypothetical protein [Demetria terragena]
MSTVTAPAPRTLFEGLIDDAAVFPPGNFSLAEAISRRTARRGHAYQDFVGPLLLPPRLVADALESTIPLTIAVVGRPDVPLGEVLQSAESVAQATGHSLAGIEVGYLGEWRSALELGVPIAVEVPHTGFEAMLDDLAADRLEQVRAKLRTGSTPANSVPTPEQLAQFLECSTTRHLAFKLTGGMHRAVSHRAATPEGSEDQFGALNVLLATDELLSGGSLEAAGALLRQRDRRAIAALSTALDGVRAERVRSAFHSYGCCDVLDPIQDLSDLYLIEETS